MVLVLMSFLNEKGYNFKLSNYGVYFSPCVQFNRVLKKNIQTTFVCTVKLILFLLDEYYNHLDVFCCILLLKCLNWKLYCVYGNTRWNLENI